MSGPEHELGRPKEQLRFSLFAKVGRHPSQVGVEGCNKRISYTRAVVVNLGGPDVKGPWNANVVGENVAEGTAGGSS